MAEFAVGDESPSRITSALIADHPRYSASATAQDPSARSNRSPVSVGASLRVVRVSRRTPQEVVTQAIRCARPGAMIGCVDVPHGVELDGQWLFFSQTGMLGGPAPVRRFLPHLIDLVLERKIEPGKGLRPDVAARGRRRRPPHHGRATRNQDLLRV